MLAAVGGLIMWRGNGIGRGTAFLLGSLYGAAYFMRALGTALLDPSTVDWLLSNDLAQHYGGWAMFRHSPWTWPPGMTTTLAYPVGTSIVYTDSLPLFALLLKPFSAWLPASFQYIGLWMFLSFTLQGGFAALLMRRYTSNPAVCIGAAAFFVAAPILLDRFGHDTLTAQWLILAAFWLYLRPSAQNPQPASIWQWWMLCAIAALVHPYLTVMVLAIMVAAMTRANLVDHIMSLRQASTAIVGAGAIVLAAWWISGAFIIPSSASSGGVPYGIYSFNLLGFFNPDGHSAFIPAIPAGNGQHEGFAWPGLGMWLLFLLAGIYAIWQGGAWKTSWRRHWPLALCIAFFTVFAVSTVVMIGPWKLFDRPIGNPLIGVFRSSGRFIWPAYYLVMLVTLGYLARRLPAMGMIGLLLSALVIQFADARNIATHYAMRRSDAQQPPAGAKLTDPQWQKLVETRQHLTLLPPRGCGPSDAYLPFLLLAADNSMTVNSAYLARVNHFRLQAYCEQLTAQLRDGKSTTNELYIIENSEWMAQFPEMLRNLDCTILDGYSACVTKIKSNSQLPDRSPD
jgi:hypothetical protein